VLHALHLIQAPLHLAVPRLLQVEVFLCADDLVAVDQQVAFELCLHLQLLQVVSLVHVPDVLQLALSETLEVVLLELQVHFLLRLRDMLEVALEPAVHLRVGF
jgi:hypothetical protein